MPALGLRAGQVLGEAATLRWGDLSTGSPAVDYVLTEAVGAKKLFAVLMNDTAHPVTAQMRPDAAALTRGPRKNWTAVVLRDASGKSQPASVPRTERLRLRCGERARRAHVGILIHGSADEFRRISVRGVSTRRFDYDFGNRRGRAVARCNAKDTSYPLVIVALIFFASC